jgi:glycosyltransferase involved in cell wall biosynthesis
LQAQMLGIERNVILTGRIPYALAPIHLALGDAAVAPKLSVTEGSGKLLNYMAMSLPTVAFDTPVAREYLGVHGFYALRGDVQSLADHLLSALNTPERGGLLRQRAMQHFDWLRAGQQIAAVYGRLIEAQRTGAVRRTWIATQK